MISTIGVINFAVGLEPPQKIQYQMVSVTQCIGHVSLAYVTCVTQRYGANCCVTQVTFFNSMEGVTLILFVKKYMKYSDVICQRLISRTNLTEPPARVDFLICLLSKNQLQTLVVYLYLK